VTIEDRDLGAVRGVQRGEPGLVGDALRAIGVVWRMARPRRRPSCAS